MYIHASYNYNINCTRAKLGGFTSKLLIYSFRIWSSRTLIWYQYHILPFCHTSNNIPMEKQSRTILLSFTYHPLHAIQAASLCSGVYRQHAVPGSGIQPATCLQHQVLEHSQVALLSCKVYRCHVIVHRRVGTRKEEKRMSVRMFCWTVYENW